MDKKSEFCCIKWNNYQGYVNEILVELLNANSMEDVTLCAQGLKIRAHRIILSACSSFFKEIFANIDDSNPIIILCDINYEDIKSIVEFVYSGELNIVAEKFPSVLKTAEILKIRGLMGVSHHLSSLNINTSISVSNSSDVPSPGIITEIKTEEITNEITLLDNNTKDLKRIDESIIEDPEEELDFIQNNEEQNQIKNRKPRKESNKKVYNEGIMMAALEELKRGKSLVQTASAHKIPRSTLYVRARNMGVTTNLTRQEYSADKVRQAFKAVAGGATLRQASELYKIPKTVLWRRVQKEDSVKLEGGLVHRRISKRSYDASSKAEAIKALERGEKLTKVAQQFKIPKATLFREKTRLVECGKLPWNSLRKRVKDQDNRLQSRLNEAVEACREGRMSHASAAIAFQVPKTTIWRRMQQLGGSSSRKSEIRSSKQNIVEQLTSENIGEVVSKEVDAAVAQLQEQSSFTLVEVPVTSQLPVTYMDEFPEASLIILTNDEPDNISLQESDQIIVSTETDIENLKERNEEVLME